MGLTKYTRQLHYLLIGLLLFFSVGHTTVFAVGLRKELSLGTYHKLKEASQLSEAGKVREAITLLRLQQGKVRQSSYDYVMMQRYLVYDYLRIDDLQAARDIALKVRKSRQLTKQVVYSMTWLIAQIDFQNEAYHSGIKYLKQLLSVQSQFSARAHFLSGFSYYKLGQAEPAERHLKQAIALENRAPKNWYQVLLAIYMERKRYHDAEAIVQLLLSRDPDNHLWWRYLVGIYMEQRREDQALAALILAHYNNHLETGDLMRIIHLYNYRGIPEKAARLLHRWLNEARLEGSYKTLKLEFKLWYFAHERSLAIAALKSAAPLADDGEDYLLLGRLHLERSEWLQAKQVLQSALQRGVKEPMKAQYLLGIAAFRSDDLDSARLAFDKAGSNPKLEQEVAYWSEKLKRVSLKVKPAATQAMLFSQLD